MLLVAPALAFQIGQPGVLNPTPGTNVFFVLYQRHEPVFLALMAMFAMGMALVARRVNPGDHQHDVPLPNWRPRQLLLCALITLATTTVGSWLVMHSIPLAMDEYVADLQAKAFAAGSLGVPVPQGWDQFGRAFTPMFMGFDAARNLYSSTYLPVYSAMRAVFVGVGAGELLNPLFAALAVPLIYRCARRLWPAETWRAWMAVAFLISSSQFLFMSMTAFAMPAHLFFNLLWLALFLRDDVAGWVSAPLVGVVALGLHNPVPHALFVAPFLLKLVGERRWRWVVCYGAVYLTGICVWYLWKQAMPPVLAPEGRAAPLFALPGLAVLGVQALSVTMILSWQTPLLALALVWVAAAWRTLSEPERRLGAGVVLSIAFYFLFPSTQGHGWGYRYTYSVLGNIALLGVVGSAMLIRSLGTAPFRKLLVASFAVTVIVQVPVRAWQIERFVQPFALAQRYVHGIDADAVIIDPTTSWYGVDLVRNDPFGAPGPKVLNAFWLRPSDKAALLERFGGRVRLLDSRELAQFGIPTFSSGFRNPPWP